MWDEGTTPALNKIFLEWEELNSPYITRNAGKHALDPPLLSGLADVWLLVFHLLSFVNEILLFSATFCLSVPTFVWLIHRSPGHRWLYLGCCCPCCPLLWVCEWASQNHPPLPTGSVVICQCTDEIAGAGDCEGGSVHPYALYNILSLLVPRYSSVSGYWLHAKFITDPDSLLATNDPYRTVQNKIPGWFFELWGKLLVSAQQRCSKRAKSCSYFFWMEKGCKR